MNDAPNGKPMFAPNARPYSELELLRVQRSSFDDQTRRLLATINQSRMDHAEDIKRFQKVGVDVQVAMANIRQREYGMVKILAALATDGKLSCTKEQCDKLQDGQRYEIVQDKDGGLTFVLHPLLDSIAIENAAAQAEIAMTLADPRKQAILKND